MYCFLAFLLWRTGVVKSDAATVAEIGGTLRKIRAMHELFELHYHTPRSMAWFGLVQVLTIEFHLYP
jgi:hypothetical protein